MHEELKRHIQAQDQYKNRFDPEAWATATEGKDFAYKVALRDQAVFMCGSPYRTADHRDWSETAMAFQCKFM